MKRIKYKYVYAEINHGTEETPNIEQAFVIKDIPYSDESIIHVQEESYNGEYEIYDDASVEQPSQLDMIEAQVTYTAMMTDTLLGV